MTHIALLTAIALVCTTLAGGAGGGLSLFPAGLGLSGPITSGAIGLRVLAEIDGDPGTFTADEIRKYAVLEQVLGLAGPTGHRTVAPLSEQFGS